GGGAMGGKGGGGWWAGRHLGRRRMAPGAGARAGGRGGRQRPRAGGIHGSPRRARAAGLHARRPAAQFLRRQPQGVAARRQRPLLGGPLLSAEGPAGGGDLEVLRGGDEVSEGRQGPRGALGAGESVPPDGELARRADRLLEAHPRLPRIRRGVARAPEADPARELTFKAPDR